MNHRTRGTKTCVRPWTMHTFYMAFQITKTGSSLPWWGLCSHAILLLFEEIPVAHTGFPIRIPEGFQKRNTVSFLRISKENCMFSILNCLFQRHMKGCSPSSWCPRTKKKTNWWRRLDYFFLSKPKNSTVTMEGTAVATLMAYNNVSTITIFTWSV